MKKVALTTGDADGIGTEITAKALKKIGLQENIQFLFIRSEKCPESHIDFLKEFSSTEQVNNLSDALISSKAVVDICLDNQPAKWVEQVAELCLEKKIDALVTAPLSKVEIQKDFPQLMGHNGILKKVCAVENDTFMTFKGNQFSVLLASPHIPVSNVESYLTKEVLLRAIQTADSFRKSNKDSRPMAILGLNPHSGEQGLIGSFEQETLIPAIKEASTELEGPLVPDFAFQERNWNKYSVFISLYHDQGLIPFKMVHGQDSGVQISLGLPILRTSVDHGTAKDIFNKNIANENSMIDAIQCALNILESDSHLEEL